MSGAVHVLSVRQQCVKQMMHHKIARGAPCAHAVLDGNMGCASGVRASPASSKLSTFIRAVPARECMLFRTCLPACMHALPACAELLSQIEHHLRHWGGSPSRSPSHGADEGGTSAHSDGSGTASRDSTTARSSTAGGAGASTEQSGGDSSSGERRGGSGSADSRIPGISASLMDELFLKHTQDKVGILFQRGECLHGGVLFNSNSKFKCRHGGVLLCLEHTVLF